MVSVEVFGGLSQSASLIDTHPLNFNLAALTGNPRMAARIYLDTPTRIEPKRQVLLRVNCAPVFHAELLNLRVPSVKICLRQAHLVKLDRV